MSLFSSHKYTVRAAALFLACVMLTGTVSCKKKDPTASSRPAGEVKTTAESTLSPEASKEAESAEAAKQESLARAASEAESVAAEKQAAAEKATPAEKEKVQKDFDAFCDRVFKESLEMNLLTTHFLLEHPEKYGIDLSEPAFPDISPTTEEEDRESLEPDLETCRNFNENLLTDEQKLTREMLLDALETDMTAVGLCLYNQPLNPLTGMQNQLPVDISEYRFDTKEDIDISIRYVEMIDEYFDDIISLENDIADAGLAPDDKALDRIIASCGPYFVPAKDNILVTSLPEKLEAFPDLTEQEKQDYVDRMEKAVEENLIPAYKKLSEELEKLKGRGTNHLGLAGFPRGKEYFAYFIASTVATDSTPEELKDRIYQRIQSDYEAISKSYMLDSGIFDRTFDAGAGKEDPKVALDYLKKEIKGHFPDIGDTSYSIKYVPESLKDIMSPAFYFIPALDGTETQNSIYINQDSDGAGNLFVTLAHEGYPGHLYQSVYFRKHGNIPIRYLTTPTGYAEGWGLYSQIYAYRLDDRLKETEKLYLAHSEAASMGIYAYLDLCVNYEGWDIPQVENFLKTEMGITDPSVAEEIFYAMVDDPGNYLMYYTGYLEISDMYNIGREELKDKFSEEEFHRFILDMAGGSFRVIKDEYAEWLKARK